MKSIRLLFILVLIITGIGGFAQTVTLQVSGQVTDEQTALPVPDHMVAVTVFPDSINFFVPFTDSTLTDQAGAYSIVLAVPYAAGTAIFLSAGTYDCTMNWLQHTFMYSGSQSSFTADFAICTDTIPPPSPCENYIIPGGIQGLTVTLQGGLNNGQTASYFWDLGDNYTASGQYITHTYAQQGVYTVVLQTVTTDSCIDFSYYTIVLMDSINPSQCENYITTGGVQGLTITLLGNMINGLPASYFWEMGDGTTITGQNVTHTYAQQGIYNVVLQTVTADSCVDYSGYTVVLIDSIPNGCNSYFTATPGINTYEIYFEGFTNSSYPTSFSFNFGDPASGTNNTSSLQNTTHIYSASGTYIVVLSTFDSTGCTFVYSSLLVIYPDSTGNMTIGGQVFAGNNVLSQGLVTLFGTDPSGYYYPVQNTYIDSSGYYNFWNLGIGSYIILAVPQPDSLSGSQYLPTFYGDVIFWEQAIPIYLGVPLNPYNINLVSFDSIGGGGGSISGQLIGGGKSMMSGGQEVLLLDAFDSPVRILYTDSQGSFGFASLPFGEYKVYPLITGITTLPALVALDAANPSATVTMTINGNTITGISESEQAGLIKNIYPNPASDEILVTLERMGSANIQILDISGKRVYVRNEFVGANNSLISIPLSDFKPGLYFIVIQDEKGITSSKRFIKN